MAEAVKNMEQQALHTWRDDFPALKQEVHGRPVAYLDTAASALKPQFVIDTMARVMETYYANIHRGLYSFSQQSTAAFEDVRNKVAGFINAPSAQEIVFTRNTTEAVNLVAQSWAAKYLQAGDEIILSGLEHHANIVPWHMLAEKVGVTIKVIPVQDDGSLDIEAFERMLTIDTKMVSLVHTSNSIGVVNNVKKIIQIAKDFYPETKVMVDGSQAVVHGSVDVQDLGCDFFAFTGHKIYGPSGVGVLWGKYDVLESMDPYQGGGDMIETVDFHHVTYKAPPARFEAGTPAIVEVIGMGAAIDYITSIGVDVIASYEKQMFAYAQDKIAAIDGLTFYGTTADKIGILSFTAEWGHPSDIGMILDQCGVAVRTGHHCCQPLMRRFGIDATVRASLGMYTNETDIDALVAGLDKARSMLA
ncbi:MAG: cysteine desulfurase [Pseudomonadota bacterium]|nr:cysteine desulfurase [Pseudomonadota bacterium]